MSCKAGPATVQDGFATKTVTLWVASSGTNLKIRRIQVFGIPHLFTDKVKSGKSVGASASASSSAPAGGKYDTVVDVRAFVWARGLRGFGCFFESNVIPGMLIHFQVNIVF